MELIIENLGRIRSARLDIKPLTLLVGPNNSNKTWTAYAVYSLLRSLGSLRSSDNLFPRLRTVELAQRIDELAAGATWHMQAVGDRGTTSLEFARKELLDGMPQEIELAVSAEELSRVLAVPVDTLNEAEVRLTLPLETCLGGANYLFVRHNPERRTFSYGESNKLPPPSFAMDFPGFPEPDEFDVRKMTFTVFGGSPPDWEDRLRGLLGTFALGTFQSVVALPAERKALVSVYKSLTAESVQRLPMPLADFVSLLKSAEASAEHSSDASRLRLRSWDRPYADALQNVAGGRVTFRRANSGVGRSLGFSPNRRLTLPIEGASSIARSLTGFVLAVGGFAPRGNVLVVDEPEMNAHPAAQLAIVEILTMLVRGGNHVIATTHSPYVIDHLNNLIAASELSADRQSEVAKRFALGSPEAFLPRSMVSAFEMTTKGIVRDLMDPQRGRLSARTFGDVSSRIENLYSDLLEPGENEH